MNFFLFARCLAKETIATIFHTKNNTPSSQGVNGPKDHWPRVLSLPGARVYGDPTQLTRDNIVEGINFFKQSRCWSGIPKMVNVKAALKVLTVTSLQSEKRPQNPV